MKRLFIFIFLSSLCFPEDLLKIKSATTLLGFGSYYLGALGYGKNTIFDFPGQTLDISDVIKVSSGSRHTIALKSDGTVWYWGYYSQENRLPFQLEWFENVVSVAAGPAYVLIAKEDGSVY